MQALRHTVAWSVYVLLISACFVSLKVVDHVAARSSDVMLSARPQRDLQQFSYNRDCPKVPPGWKPVCPKAGSARAAFQGDRVRWGAFTSSRWGNALSPYWQARALAQLSGYAFETGGFTKYWLQHLPKNVPSSNCPQPALLEEVCAMCDGPSWEYAHRCAGAWPFIRPTIINDTQRAFEAWAAATNHALPVFNPGDVVVHSRCASDTVLAHWEYGPVAFSFYEDIPKDAKQISIVTELSASPKICHAMHHLLQRHLQRIRPNANITVVSGSVATDFARLLYAPILFKDASSSFALWAAIASKGQVWSPPLMSVLSGHDPSPYLGLDWHWSGAPVLYPHVAQRLNLTLEDSDSILRWLESN